MLCIIVFIILFLEKNITQPQILAQRYHGRSFFKTMTMIRVFFMWTATKFAVPTERVFHQSAEVHIPFFYLDFISLKLNVNFIMKMQKERPLKIFELEISSRTMGSVV